MYELANSINSLILEGLESIRNSNILFENIEFRNISIKIIKNIPNEKVIFIFKNYLDKLKEILLNERESAKCNYSLNNELYQDEFKKILTQKEEQSKDEKKKNLN